MTFFSFFYFGLWVFNWSCKHCGINHNVFHVWDRLLGHVIAVYCPLARRSGSYYHTESGMLQGVLPCDSYGLFIMWLWLGLGHQGMQFLPINPISLTALVFIFSTLSCMKRETMWVQSHFEQFACSFTGVFGFTSFILTVFFFQVNYNADSVWKHICDCATTAVCRL